MSKSNGGKVEEHELVEQSGNDKMDIEVEGETLSSGQGNTGSEMASADCVSVEPNCELRAGNANVEGTVVEEAGDIVSSGEPKKGGEDHGAMDKKGDLNNGNEDHGVMHKKGDAVNDDGFPSTKEDVVDDLDSQKQTGLMEDTLEKESASVDSKLENGEESMDIEEKEGQFEENQGGETSVKSKEDQIKDAHIKPEGHWIGDAPLNSEENQVGYEHLTGEIPSKVGEKQSRNISVNHKGNPNGGTLPKPEDNQLRVTSVKSEAKKAKGASGSPEENQMKHALMKTSENQMADASVKLEDKPSEDALPKNKELHIKPGLIKKNTVNKEASKQNIAAHSRKTDGDDSGTEEEQAAFMRELQNFYKERSMDFKPPKFYGEGLNCLKLWRAVTRLGGYEQVTLCKLWRQVGESFKPPKTCTTVSWTFRCFYEKALLEYEKSKIQTGELEVSVSVTPEPVSVENQTGICQSGSGRARRDAAARAMKGWHSQRLLGNGEVGDPIIKDKSSTFIKRDKQPKSVGIFKRKKSSFDRPVKAARMSIEKPQADSMVVDVGPPAEWVKINVCKTKDCFEVYALVPGLLREEVHVQSDAAGSLVISGEPEQPDNPWGVTPFKKIVTLPSRIDPHQTSAIVTLHGQLFVRAPFEQPGS